MRFGIRGRSSSTFLASAVFGHPGVDRISILKVLMHVFLIHPVFYLLHDAGMCLYVYTYRTSADSLAPLVMQILHDLNIY